MPDPWAVPNLLMPHPRNWQGAQIPRSCPGGGGKGAAGIDWCMTLEVHITAVSKNQNSHQNPVEFAHNQQTLVINLLHYIVIFCLNKEMI